jgi:hypothetical protein
VQGGEGVFTKRQMAALAPAKQRITRKQAEDLKNAVSARRNTSTGLGPTADRMGPTAIVRELRKALTEAATQIAQNERPITVNVTAVSDASPDEIASIVVTRLGRAMTSRAGR